MVKTRRRSRFYTRSFAVFFMLLNILILGISGVILYVAPPGRYANFVGWQVLGVDKSGWESIHTNFSWVFLLLVSLHLYFNWRVIRGYLKRGLAWTIRYRRELGTATAATILVLAGSLMNWPPFSTIMDFGEEVKRHWETHRITKIGSPWIVVFLLTAFLATWGLLVVLKRPTVREQN